MKTIHINVSEEQYDMIVRACKKRKKSVREIVCRLFFEMDYEDRRNEKKR